MTVRRLPVVRQPSVARLLSFALAARRAVLDAGYDIVQSHERGLHQDIYRAGEGVHRAYLAAMGQRWATWNPHHRLVCALETRIFRLRSARHVVAISRRGKAEIERLYATPSERVSLVYNGVDLGRFHPQHRARVGRAARDALGLAGDAWTILFVGSGFARKGLRPLIQAVAQVGEPSWRLVVAGRGRYAAVPGAGRTARTGRPGDLAWPVSRRRTPVRGGRCRGAPRALRAIRQCASGGARRGRSRAHERTGRGSELIIGGQNGWVVPVPSSEAIAEGLRALRESEYRPPGRGCEGVGGALHLRGPGRPLRGALSRAEALSAAGSHPTLDFH